MNTAVSDWSIYVNIATQCLQVFYQQKVIKTYRIATAAKGPGEQYGSEQTPRGLHLIRAKIGTHHPLNSVFVKRRATGEIYSAALGEKSPHRDWITSRILWLSGQEPGKNRLGQVDSMRRKIYIHGTPYEEMLGQPSSKGCIRMANQDIIELFDLVPVYTKVFIE